MAFRVSIAIDESCDHCNKPMTEENPGVLIYASSRESGKNLIWLHLKCVEWNVLTKGRRLLRKRKELLIGTEPKAEVHS